MALPDQGWKYSEQIVCEGWRSKPTAIRSWKDGDLCSSKTIGNIFKKCELSAEKSEKCSKCQLIYFSSV